MIAVVGDLLLDVFVLSNLRQEEQRHGVVIRGGGSAANTAAWLAHLGAEVAFIGCVGDDVAGQMLVAELEEQRVDARVRVLERDETGAVVVQVSREGERAMRSSRGANHALSPADIQDLVPASVAWLHLTGYSLLCPTGLDVLREVASVAQQNNATLSFDPSSAAVVRALGTKSILDALRDCRVSLLLPSATEAMALTDERDLNKAVSSLSKLVPAVIVKDGAVGAILSGAEESKRVPTMGRCAKDTTGAGDAFNAGVIAALQSEWNLEKACIAGNKAAGQVIGHYGGRPIITRESPV